MTEQQYSKTCQKCHRAYMSNTEHVCKEEDVKDKKTEKKE